jgi:hypothetical protein
MEIIKSYMRALSGFNVNIKLLLLRTIIMGLYAGVYGIIFNLYILDLGYRTDFLGLLLSVSLLTSSIVSIPAGILCDRFDRRKLMLVQRFVCRCRRADLHHAFPVRTAPVQRPVRSVQFHKLRVSHAGAGGEL